MVGGACVLASERRQPDDPKLQVPADHLQRRLPTAPCSRRGGRAFGAIGSGRRRTAAALRRQHEEWQQKAQRDQPDDQERQAEASVQVEHAADGRADRPAKPEAGNRATRGQAFVPGEGVGQRREARKLGEALREVHPNQSQNSRKTVENQSKINSKIVPCRRPAAS